MNATITAAVAAERNNDMVRAAAAYRQAAEAATRPSVRTPRRRATWWTRVAVPRA
jgi:hypothetical protein